jgi:hypothetical protein
VLTETYAQGRPDQSTRAGGFIVLTVSILAAILVAAGLIYALGTGQRHQAALAAAECEPNLSPSGLQCTTMPMLVSRYRRMTTPAVQQLTADMAAYAASERHNLAAAKAALRAEVTSENALDTGLGRFPFPAAVAPIGAALVRADHARARLIAQQARSTSLSQLRSFDHRSRAANAAVQTQMKLLRTALETRPRASQEP